MISIVIPAYNNPADVDALLSSLMAHCRQRDRYEVIVVDDGSRDNAISSVCAPHTFVRYVRLSENRGAASARNAGVALAQYDLVMFLDSDMVVLTDVIDIAVRMFQDPQMQAAIGAVSEKSMNPGRFKKFWALVKAFSHPGAGYSSTFWPTIGVIRTAIFREVGGFNEQFRGASVEEYEFSMRLEACGYRVHCNPMLSVGTHYKDMRTSLRQSFSRAAKWVLLFWQRRRFDNHTTTRTQATVMVCGAGFVGSTLLAPLYLGSAVMAAGFLGLYLWLTIPFMLYVKSIAGSRFVPVVLFFHLILSVVVTAGALRGAIQLFFGPERRRALLYS